MASERADIHHNTRSSYPSVCFALVYLAENTAIKGEKKICSVIRYTNGSLNNMSLTGARNF